MKIFLDRISDLLEIPELLPQGRPLRGRRGVRRVHLDFRRAVEGVHGAFLETFSYLGMQFGGMLHVNCRDGFLPAIHDGQADEFANRLREAGASPIRAQT